MSTGVPIPGVLGRELIQVIPPLRQYGLHNAKKAPKETMYVGTMKTLPAVNVIGPNPVLDEDGDPIPGSTIFEDVYNFNAETGEDDLVFDAQKAVCHILGIKRDGNGIAAVADSGFSRAGVSILPIGCSKELWKEIAKDGSERVFQMEIAKAYTLVSDVDTRNAKLKAAGGEGTALTPNEAVAYEKAKITIRHAEKILQSQAEAEMAPHEEDILDEEIELAVRVKAAAMELATKHAPKGASEEDRLKLAESLLEDPMVRNSLQKKFRIRKRGHLEEGVAEKPKAAGRKSK